MGEATAPLVVEVARLQLKQVTGAEEMGRLEAPLSLINSYIGQTNELAGVAVAEDLFTDLFVKI